MFGKTYHQKCIIGTCEVQKFYTNFTAPTKIIFFLKYKIAHLKIIPFYPDGLNDILKILIIVGGVFSCAIFKYKLR